jgi:hypothetical protein
VLGSDPGRTRSGRPRGEWYQRACSGPPGDPSWGPPVGLVVVQTFEAKASGEPRAICIAEPKRSHSPLVACALSAIPTECGGVQARSETKRPSAVDTGRSIGANGCQVTNRLRLRLRRRRSRHLRRPGPPLPAPWSAPQCRWSAPRRPLAHRLIIKIGAAGLTIRPSGTVASLATLAQNPPRQETLRKFPCPIQTHSSSSTYE